MDGDGRRNGCRSPLPEHPYPAAPDFTEWGAAESKRLARSIIQVSESLVARHLNGRSGRSPSRSWRAQTSPSSTTRPYPATADLYGRPLTRPPRCFFLPSAAYRPLGRPHPRRGHRGDEQTAPTPQRGHLGCGEAGVDNAVRLPRAKSRTSRTIRLVGGGHDLEDAITVEDPKAY